ncbi:sulfurtransferase [Jeotgalibacillus haloalkalitolerans]|uniref:Sulfurtransferase n=1 Tax=Jeotgalibacillus haloalkalitolerans TaxID=3104292 RepID=A0ABU5KL34_9BACL|nr:sulfurtransferase [Jeotgalibacillus sp. HH7-29]MDZ5711964.1 sulfurtransferase [Jeotgalibacillus sp. HH7-29]
MHAAVSAEWLLEQIELKRPMAILDCRFDLKSPESGMVGYRQSHIPGSYYVHLDHDLSGEVKTHGGRHPLPDLTVFKRKMEQSGVSDQIPVVVYDRCDGAFAARAWWLLHYAGHEQVYILNGGYREWTDKQYPVTDQIPEEKNTTFHLHIRHDIVADRKEVENVVSGKQSACLIDSRDYARYIGDHEPIDRVPGHIPGAINNEWVNSFENGWLLDPDEQAKRFSEWDKKQPLIVYCGSGVTACPNYIALKQAGFKEVKLYPGSYSDWVSYDDHEIELGDATHIGQHHRK